MSILFLLHTILLIASVAGVYFWLSFSTLSLYTLQLVAFLVLVYTGSHWLRRHRPTWFHRSSITVDVTILTAMILLLVTETGALSSPFFFLCYFLLFGVAMLYEIEATLVLTGVLITFFLFLPGTKFHDLSLLSELLALLMITPLAIFTSHQYETKLSEERHLEREETDTLIFLSLNLKRTLISALDTLSLVIPQAKVKEVRSSLQTLYSDLKNLYRSADELQQTIDRETEQDK